MRPSNQQPLRILCVFASLDRGGAETMCMNLYRNINRELVQFDFVKHTSQICAYEEEIKSLGGKIFLAPKYTGRNHFQYCAWWKNHFETHPEHVIVHGHYITLSAVYCSLAKKMGRFTIGHSHSTKPQGSWIQQVLKRAFVRLASPWLCSRLACSQKAGENYFPCRDFIVLNNAVDTQKFKFDAVIRKSVRKALNLSDAFVIGIVGSLSPVKNPFGTIEIFKAVHQHNPKAKLLWVGGGPLQNEIVEKLKTENLWNDVIMTGVRSDVNELLQAMDVFVLPSFWEGLGMVAIEAQTSGLPCFISDTVPEEVAVTDLCTFLPIHDPACWADAVLSVDINQRKDTSQQIIKAGYDIHSTAKWLENFYQRVVENLK